MLGQNKFIITDEGLVEDSSTNRNIQKWSGIISVEQNQEMIFIFVDRMAAYIISKRFFKDENEQETFLSLIGEKMSSTI